MLARLAPDLVSDADDLLASMGSVTVAGNLADELQSVVAVASIELGHLDLLLQFVFSPPPTKLNWVVEAAKILDSLPGHLSIAI